MEKLIQLGYGGFSDEIDTIQGYQPISADTAWTFTNNYKDKDSCMIVSISSFEKFENEDCYTLVNHAYLRRDGSFAHGSDGYKDPKQVEFRNVYPGQSVTFRLSDAMKCMGRDASEDLLYRLDVCQKISGEELYNKYYYKSGDKSQEPVDPNPEVPGIVGPDPVEIDPVEKFTDVNAGAWYVDPIKYVLSNNLFKGTSNTTFSPNTPMTRAMFVVVLARSVGASQDGVNIWYDKDVQWAMDKGYYDGRNPQGNISRQEMALMLYRRAGSPAVSGSLDGFVDADTVSAEAKDAMLWAVQNGYLKGMGQNNLKPYGSATRAEVATIFMRVFG